MLSHLVCSVKGRGSVLADYSSITIFLLKVLVLRCCIYHFLCLSKVELVHFQ